MKLPSKKRVLRFQIYCLKILILVLIVEGLLRGIAYFELSPTDGFFIGMGASFVYEFFYELTEGIALIYQTSEGKEKDNGIQD